MKLQINIQSISDIITNSSSEIFRVIKAKDEDQYNMFKDIIEDLSYCNILSTEYFSEQRFGYDINDEDKVIKISYPYCASEEATDFIAKGLEEIFGADNISFFEE